MYLGKHPEELIELMKQYYKLFGNNPDGNEAVEFGDDETDEYIEILKRCIQENKRINELFDEEDKLLS